MLTPEELEIHLRYAAKHPTELSRSPEFDNGIATLIEENLFRPGEMVGIMVHPTNAGPIPPSDGFPEAHRHAFIEVAYIWNGTCSMEVEGSRFTMEAGDILILDTHSAHRPMVPKETLLVNLVLQTAFFNESFFRNFSKDDPLAGFFANTVYSQKAVKRYLLFQTKNDSRIRQLFTMLLQEYFAREVCSKSIIENLTMIFFSTVVRLQLQKCANVTSGEKSNDNFIAELLEYMQENLASVTRETLADHFGYSYSYITTILQSGTGMTFSALKNTLRLQKAELLLRTTDRPINTVAHDSGFSNVTRFYELFHREYGQTPQEYRRKLKPQ